MAAAAAVVITLLLALGVVAVAAVVVVVMQQRDRDVMALLQSLPWQPATLRGVLACKAPQQVPEQLSGIQKKSTVSASMTLIVLKKIHFVVGALNRTHYVITGAVGKNHQASV